MVRIENNDVLSGTYKDAIGLHPGHTLPHSLRDSAYRLGVPIWRPRRIIVVGHRPGLTSREEWFELSKWSGWRLLLRIAKISIASLRDWLSRTVACRFYTLYRGIAPVEPAAIALRMSVLVLGPNPSVPGHYGRARPVVESTRSAQNAGETRPKSCACQRTTTSQPRPQEPGRRPL